MEFSTHLWRPALKWRILGRWLALDSLPFECVGLSKFQVNTVWSWAVAAMIVFLGRFIRSKSPSEVIVPSLTPTVCPPENWWHRETFAFPFGKAYFEGRTISFSGARRLEYSKYWTQPFWREHGDICVYRWWVAWWATWTSREYDQIWKETPFLIPHVLYPCWTSTVYLSCLSLRIKSRS